jgi:hypothetical protein
LLAEVAAVGEQGGDRRPDIAVVPGKRVVDFIVVGRLSFKRAHVVVLLRLVPQQALFLDL